MRNCGHVDLFTNAIDRVSRYVHEFNCLNSSGKSDYYLIMPITVILTFVQFHLIEFYK